MEDSGDAQKTFEGRVEIPESDSAVMNVFGARRPSFLARANANGLFIEDALVVAADAVKSAFVSIRQNQPRVVVIDSKNQRHTFLLHNREGADQLVKALGFGISQKTARFPIGAEIDIAGMVPTFAVLAALIAALYVPRADWRNVLPFVISFWVVVFFANRINKARDRGSLLIGRDGIAIFKSPKSRFIPFADVVAISRDVSAQFAASALVITLQNDERVRVPISTAPIESDDDSAIVDRAKAAWAAWHAEASTESAEILQRRGRKTREWIDSLVALGAGNDTAYREISLDRETLLSIAESPSNQASARAAAAIALGKNLDDEARARLRASAKAVAAPNLRVAIEHVIEKNSEADFETILDGLDPIDRAKR